MAKISIIVPVYNVEKYLKRCIDSILNQTFSDFELILIDDGSPDSCPQICDEYAAKDSRIKIIHIKNGGVSSARNLGLDIATGEWISFIDSDDWVHKDYLLYLYNAAVDSGRLISATASIDVHEYIDDNNAKADYHLENATDSLFAGNDFVSFVWAKLYNRKIWDGFRFVNGMIMEDLYTIPEVILQEELIAVLDENLYYYYRANPESITSSKSSSFKLYNDHYLGCEKNIELFKKNNDTEHVIYFIRRAFNFSIWAYEEVKSTDDKKFKRTAKRRCYSILRKHKECFDFKDKDFEWNLCQLSPSFRFMVKVKSLIGKIFPFCSD